MQMKQWGIRVALGFVFCVSALGCHLTDTFLAQATITPTRTRTVKPTFTTIPSPTVTPIPPTPPLTLTSTPTRRPTPRPPTRTPTRPPAPTAVPQPTVSPFQYATANVGCVHAGNQYIKGRVYDSKDPSANGVAGLKVGLGDSSGTNPWVTVDNEGDGFYTFTLSIEGEPGKPAGTYYVWLMDGSGRRISDIGGPIRIDPGTGDCWAGTVDFYRR